MENSVSIIIPTFNSESSLPETLDSVLEQTYQNWECLIVDDGSTDDTGNIINKYIARDGRFSTYSRKASLSKGPSTCRNIGWRNSRGNFVIFLDSDDLLAPDCLENRIAFSDRFPDSDIWVFTSKTFIDSPEDNNRIFNSIPESNDSAFYLDLFRQGKYPFCVMGPLWRRSSLEACDGFDERLQVFEDPDLHIRALLKGLEVSMDTSGVPDSFYRITFRKPSDRRTKLQQDKLLRSAYIFFQKHLDKHPAEMRGFARTFFWKEVLPYGLSSGSGKLYGLLLRRRMLSIKEIMAVPFLLLYKKFGWDKQKGTGYNFMKRWVNENNSTI